MIDTKNGTKTSRIIVGWQSNDAIDHSVEAATLLAAVMQSEIVGLFVQDDDMIQLADLSFVRVVTPVVASAEQMTPQSIAAAYARSAATCRRILSQQAANAQVKWSFAIERGEFPVKIHNLAEPNDFIVLPGNIQGFGAKQLMQELRSSPTDIRGVLITGLREAGAQVGPVIAIDDGDEKGEQTIELAARLAAAKQVQLVIFAVTSTDAMADEIIRRAKKISGQDTQLTAHRFPPGAPQLIATATGEFNPSFVVGDRQGEPFGEDRSVLSLLRACKAPVLMLH